MLEWKMAAIIPSLKKNLKLEVYNIYNIYFQKITVRLWFSGTELALFYILHFFFQFYFYILAVSSALLCVYILCNLYNLIWIVCPQLGTMYRIICRYQEHVEPALNHHVSSTPNLIKYKNNSASQDEVTIPLATGKSTFFKKKFIKFG